MIRFLFNISIVLVFFGLSCEKDGNSSIARIEFRGVKKISYDGISVDIVIDKPKNDTLDVLITFHGTVIYDNKILEAANNTLDGFKRILSRTDMMIVSVAYPEEGLLMGDNIMESEAALLWIKNKANNELGIQVEKIFLAGHSQGGYIVTRLNTMHSTDGVVANGPGPLNLVYRCQLEETGQIENGITCGLLNKRYGTTTNDPDSYFERSLLNFTNYFKSDILFVQGLNDSFIQMASWPEFKNKLKVCNSCQKIEILELANYGHQALFESDVAIDSFNEFINRK
jgi:hypothetical protein